MSSCCLAACGRLAENSQPGEAAFNSLWTGSPGTSAPSAGSHGRGGPCGVLGLWFWRVWGGSGVRLPQKCFRVPLPEPCPQHKGKGRHAGSEPFPPHPRPSSGPADTAPAAAVPRTHSWLRDRTERPAAHLPWAETYPDKKKSCYRGLVPWGPQLPAGGCCPRPPSPTVRLRVPLWPLSLGRQGGERCVESPRGPSGTGRCCPEPAEEQGMQNCFSQSHWEAGTGGMEVGAGRKTRGLRTFAHTPHPAEVLQISDPSPLPPVGSALWSLLPGPGAFSAAPCGC